MFRRIEWFKIVVSLFLLGILCVGHEYVQTQKEIAKNGLYQVSSSAYGYVGVNTRTGIIYEMSAVNEIPK